LIRRGAGKFEEYGAHPTIRVTGPVGQLKHALIHNAYPTLRGYIDHMNSYSSSGAEVAVTKGHRSFSLLDIVIRPKLTFIYNYFFAPGISGWTRGIAAPRLSCSLCFVEICESLGIGARQQEFIHLI